MLARVLLFHMRPLRAALSVLVFAFSSRVAAFDVAIARLAARFAFSSYEPPPTTPPLAPPAKPKAGEVAVYRFDPTLPQPALPALECSASGHAMIMCRRIAFLDAEVTDAQVGVWTYSMGAGPECIAVAFRGTELDSPKDILTDVVATQREIDCSFLGDSGGGCGPGARAHGGFLRAYLSVRRALRAVLSEVGVPTVGHGGGPRVLLCGHSLGGALAQLCSVDLAAAGAGEGASGETSRVAVYTFGSPRVGNGAFAAAVEAREAAGSLGTWRVVVEGDAVPRLPRGTRANRLVDYRHAGATVTLAAAARAGAWAGAAKAKMKAPPVLARVATGGGDGGDDPLAEVDPGYRGLFPIDFRRPVRLAFLAAELRLLGTILRGEAVRNHLRGAYDRALCVVAVEGPS